MAKKIHNPVITGIITNYAKSYTFNDFFEILFTDTEVLYSCISDL